MAEPFELAHMGPYVYADPDCVLEPGELFRAIDCFDYQACEHPDWSTSETFRFLEALRKAAGRRTVGYETSPWGWGPEDLCERCKPDRHT